MSVEIIAEMSNAHNGDLARAHRIIDAMKAAGVDACKFQCFTPDELVALRGDGPAPEPWGSQGWSMRDLYTKAQTPHAWFPELVRHCEDIGLPWFSSVFGPESLALLESLGCPRYKLASLDVGAVEWRDAVWDAGKPVIASAPDADSAPWAEIDYILLCPPGYPTREMHLGELDGHGGLFDGYSYHGTNWRVLPAAVAAGARIVEAHFQLRGEPSELESTVSLDEHQFAQAVEAIREVETWL